ncbi:MAG: M23 family metallopeptidase, partial [Bdellovibrionia bacterium]
VFETTLSRDGDRLIVRGSGDPGLGDPELLKETQIGVEDILAAWVEAVRKSGGDAPKELVIDGQSIMFPVHGKNDFRNDWQEGRVGHLHEGTDVFAEKLIPVLAIADGNVSWLRRKSQGNEGVSIEIGHGPRWQSRYFHLNNDSGSKVDDGKGQGIALHLKVGTRVRAGEIIGWVGDSGNAEKTKPHLHFEILYYERPINPYKSLVEARRLPLN